MSKTLDQKIDAEAERLASHYTYQFESFIRQEFGNVGFKASDFSKAEKLVRNFVKASMRKAKDMTIAEQVSSAISSPQLNTVVSNGNAPHVVSNKCPRPECNNLASSEAHTCPYACDVNDDYESKCFCCEDCAYECEMDI